MYFFFSYWYVIYSSIWEFPSLPDSSIFMKTDRDDKQNETDCCITAWSDCVSFTFPPGDFPALLNYSSQSAPRWVSESVWEWEPGERALLNKGTRVRRYPALQHSLHSLRTHSTANPDWAPRQQPQRSPFFIMTEFKHIQTIIPMEIKKHLLTLTITLH